jgi:hypothetical protein
MSTQSLKLVTPVPDAEPIENKAVLSMAVEVDDIYDDSADEDFHEMTDELALDLKYLIQCGCDDPNLLRANCVELVSTATRIAAMFGELC